jgi:hypothetical protein
MALKTVSSGAKHLVQRFRLKIHRAQEFLCKGKEKLSAKHKQQAQSLRISRGSERLTLGNIHELRQIKLKQTPFFHPTQSQRLNSRFIPASNAIRLRINQEHEAQNF